MADGGRQVSGRIRVLHPWSDREEEIRRRLRNYRALVDQHKACKELYDQLFPRQTTQLHDGPLGGQVEMYEIESVVDQRMDLSRQMDRSLHDMQVEISAVLDMIQELPPAEYTILMRRYLMAETWEEVSKMVKYCPDQAIRIHNKAIMRLGRKMSNHVE